VQRTIKAKVNLFLIIEKNLIGTIFHAINVEKKVISKDFVLVAEEDAAIPEIDTAEEEVLPTHQAQGLDQDPDQEIEEEIEEIEETETQDQDPGQDLGRDHLQDLRLIVLDQEAEAEALGDLEIMINL
jgi:hypothetical protein